MLSYNSSEETKVITTQKTKELMVHRDACNSSTIWNRKKKIKIVQACLYITLEDKLMG